MLKLYISHLMLLCFFKILMLISKKKIFMEAIASQNERFKTKIHKKNYLKMFDRVLYTLLEPLLFQHVLLKNIAIIVSHEI